MYELSFQHDVIYEEMLRLIFKALTNHKSLLTTSLFTLITRRLTSPSNCYSLVLF